MVVLFCPSVPETADSQKRAAGELFEGPDFGEMLDEATISIDADQDSVPDALEPIMCDVENANTPSDGYCLEENFTPFRNCSDFYTDALEVEDWAVFGICFMNDDPAGRGIVIVVLASEVYI